MQASDAWNKLLQNTAFAKLSAIARHISSIGADRFDELVTAVAFRP
jgi:hypothetical protein